MISKVTKLLSTINRLVKQVFYFSIKSQKLLFVIFEKTYFLKSLFFRTKPYFVKSSKIFGIGLSKTGTTSLAKALEELGYKTKDWPHLPNLYEEINNHDALTDETISFNFKKLDRKFPNSKFILTIREIDSWIISYKKQLEHIKKKRELKKWEKKIMKKLYGSISFKKTIFIETYNKHIHNVKNYFKNRTIDLLIINIIAGEGYEKLCPFLRKKILGEVFPHKNIGKYLKK